MTTSKKILFFLVLLVLIVAGWWFFSARESSPALNNNQLVNEQNQDNQNVGLANPASVNCLDQGGQLVMKEKPDGSQYGLCYFDDNRACEEWSMYRGDCPVGGMKTTGYDTEAQRFCAWNGGSTTATENALCVLPDGRACLADDFYLGQCEE